MGQKKALRFLFFFLVTIIPVNVYAEMMVAGSEQNLIARMTVIVFQLSIIIFAAWIGGAIFRKLKMPSVLGEIIAGLVIGPYCLGHIALPGFSYGVFPILQGDFPVTPELYSFATVASLVLLFLVGLETDIKTFFRYSIAGSVLGLSGVIASFICGDILGILFANQVLGVAANFFHPLPLFMGVVSTATSVGITARILSDKKKMDSPEGVTILAAAVIDDVLGIILLAVVIGIARSGHIEWRQVSVIGLKAIGIWLGFTALGITFAYKIGAFLKFFKDKGTISIMSFALAMFLAGIFEKSGLAMIIGAYIMGLSLSKTDLSLLIQQNLGSLQKFFVPIFFCVMGMLVDVSHLGSPVIIKFSIIYIILAVLGKLIGCYLPALFLNFNNIGALRIGVGMIPRGEVALIIIGIGLSAGILPREMFTIAVFMTFVTTLLTPPILAKLFDSKQKGIRKEKEDIDAATEEIIYEVPNPETAEFILRRVLSSFEQEGFYVYSIESENELYQLRKDMQIIFLHYTTKELIFSASSINAPFIHTLFYEVLADLEHMIKSLKGLTDKKKIGQQMFKVEKAPTTVNKTPVFDVKSIIKPTAINIDLKGNDKEEILEELVDLLISSNQLEPKHKAQVLKAVKDREKSLSTGMQEGIAFPHARSSVVKELAVGIGIKKKGMDFASLDGKPSKIFIITLAPKDSPKPYLQFIAGMTQILAKHSESDYLLSLSTRKQLYNTLINTN